MNVTPANKTLTSATAPLALQTPVPGVQVEVTEPEVAVLKDPAVKSSNVNVTVTLALSTSVTTMSIRFKKGERNNVIFCESSSEARRDVVG